MNNAFIIDVTEETFQKEVIEASQERPVVVDFWAGWCGPCKTLGPILEGLATEAAGAWRLAKIDVDQNPRLAQVFQVRGIPAVKGVRDGVVVDEFTGALPEHQIRAWLEGILPGPEAALIDQARSLDMEGKRNEAMQTYEKVLEQQPRHGDALFELARLELAAGKADVAERHLDMILPDDATRLEKEIAALRLRLAGDGLDEAERLVKERPDDLEAKVGLGRALAAGGRYEEALDVFLDVVRASPRVGPGEEARLAMLDVFNAAGSRSELSDRFRSLMAAELYK